MIQNPETVINEFRDAMEQIGLRCGDIQHELQTCPHTPHGLPPGKCAIYVFSLSKSSGKRCPAGAGRVLKIGKAGPNSNARFQSQHSYPGRAPSTLATMLINSRILWRYLGIKELRNVQVENWIGENTSRDNFYLDAVDNDILGELERYLEGRFGPVFEGG